MFNLVCADESGNIFADPELEALGGEGEELWELAKDEMIPLPPGADVVVLPGRRAVGTDPATGKPVTPEGKKGASLWAVAALLPPGYTRLFLPAFEKEQGRPPMGLFGYTAVGARGGELFAAAYPLDPTEKWSPLAVPRESLGELVEKKLRDFPQNRILRQLATCTLEYHCLTARNIFLGKWEGGLPVSPRCNAACVGCISLQEAECCPSPQNRIKFTPTAAEVAELAIPHLDRGEDAIVSFGQGCEGEPLLQAETIAEAIRLIRARTSRGTIHVNTNAGNTGGVRMVADAGLNSIRVSLISARPDCYRAYHRPAGYTFENVVKSLKLAREAGVYTSVNLLVMPGFTDRRRELEALLNLVRGTGVRMIQLRNLNLDPEDLFRIMPRDEEVLGIKAWMAELKREIPDVILGSYTRTVRKEKGKPST